MTLPKIAKVTGALICVALVISAILFFYNLKKGDINNGSLPFFYSTSTKDAVSDFNAGNLDSAIKKTEDEVASTSENIGALLVLAASYAQKGSLDFEESKYGQLAIDTAQKVLALDPKNTEAYRIIGYGYEIMRRYSDAIENYNKALALDPKNPVLLYHLGHAYDLSGDFNKAKDNYQQALAIDPTNPQAGLNLARVFMREGNYKDAKNLIEKSIPETVNKRALAEAYYALSSINLYLDQDKISSLKNAEKAVQADPSFSQAYVSEVRVYLANNNFSKVAETLGKAIDLNPNSSFAFEWLGMSYFKNGQNSDAEAAFLKAQNLAKTDITIMEGERSSAISRIDYELAAVYASEGKKDLAVNHIESALPNGDVVVVNLITDTIKQAEKGLFKNLIGFPAYDKLARSVKDTEKTTSGILSKMLSFLTSKIAQAYTIDFQGHGSTDQNSLDVQFGKVLNAYAAGNLTYSQAVARCNNILIASGNSSVKCQLNTHSDGSMTIGCNNITTAVYEPDLLVSCSPEPKTATVSATTSASIVWSSIVSGGVGGYKYNWSGDDGLSGSGSQAWKSYSTSGNKEATILVTSGHQKVSRTCRVDISDTPSETASAEDDALSGIWCSVSPSTIKPGDTATWSVHTSSTTAPYTYDWSGTTGGLTEKTASVSKKYDVAGNYLGKVSVSLNGTTKKVSCSNDLRVQREDEFTITTLQSELAGVACKPSINKTTTNLWVTYSVQKDGKNLTQFWYKWSGDVVATTTKSNELKVRFDTPGKKKVNVDLLLEHAGGLGSVVFSLSCGADGVTVVDPAIKEF